MDQAMDDGDLLYEEDILRNAYSLKYWWRYMEAKKRSPARQRNVVAERALKYLPGCYKIWRAYLNDRREQCRAKPPGHPAHARLHAAYERALVFMCAGTSSPHRQCAGWPLPSCLEWPGAPRAAPVRWYQAPPCQAVFAILLKSLELASRTRTISTPL
jgi:hypothetical protein